MSNPTIIKAAGDYEYGVLRAYEETYLARCAKSSYDPAEAVAAAVAACPDYLSRISTGDNLYVATHNATLDEHGEVDYRVRVDVKYLPAHMLEGNYIFQVRGMVQTQESSRDCNGNLVVVDYYDPVQEITLYQTGTFQAAFPGVEIVATGISATANPTDIVKNWLGYANSAQCWGFGEYCILCVDVSYEPWDLEAAIPKYKFKFSFQVITNQMGTSALESGYALFVMFKNSSGQTPSDVSLGNGIELVYPYLGLDYTATFPFEGRL